MDEQRECKRHGINKHYKYAAGQLKCSKCVSEAVIRRAHKIKQILVAEAGGKCIKCGYNKCQQALVFHHREPEAKSFGLSGGTISLQRQREEAAKCDLLCANCHTETHHMTPERPGNSTFNRD